MKSKDILKIGLMFDPNFTSPYFGSRPGYYLETTVLVCEILGLSCEFVFYSGRLGTFGNGTATGYYGALLNGTFDSTGPSMTPSIERQKYFEFPNFVFEDSPVFITRRPTSRTYSWSSFLEPLSTKVWLAIILCLLLTCILVTVANFLQTKLNSWMNLIRNLFDALLALGAYLVRKSPRIPYSHGISANTVICLWGILALLIISSYSGRLLASMLRTSTKPPFKDFPELTNCIERNDCEMIFLPNFFKSAVLGAKDDGSDYGELKKAVHKRPLVTLDLREAYDQILSNSEKFLVTGPRNIVEASVVAGNSCQLFFIPSGVKVYTTFLFRKGDQRAKQFDSALRTLNSLGLIQAIYRRYPPSDVCDWIKLDGKRREMPSALPLDSLRGPLVIFVGGLGLGWLLFALEQLICRSRLTGRRIVGEELQS